MRSTDSLALVGPFFLMLGCLSTARAYVTMEREVYKDIRYMGRGGTGTSSTYDGAALFYNPAGLAFNNGFSLKIANPTFGTNRNVYESAKTGIDYKSDDSESLVDKFSPYIGKQLGVAYNVYPNFSMPYFAIGYFNVGSADMTYRNPVNPEFIIRARYDRGVILGGALPLASRLSLGFSVKYLQRTQIFSDISGADLLLASSAAIDRYLQSGQGWGVNLGALGRFPMGQNSTLNFGTGIQDVGDTKVKNAKAPKSQPGPQTMIWSAGTSYEYETDNLGFKALFDMKHLSKSGLSYTKKIHMGAELSFLRMDFRLGFNQGYYTAGFSSRIFKLLYFDAVTYGEELDSAAGLRENRVYMIGFTFGLDMMGGKNGRKQKLSLDDIK